jgi:hypothetical protein
MKKLISLLLLICLISFCFSSQVTRVAPETIAPNQEFEVKLIVDVSSEDTIYGIEETYPFDFILVDSGKGDSTIRSQLKWIEMNATPGQKIITYKLKAPESQIKGYFTGSYQFETQSKIVEIDGSKSITVSDSIGLLLKLVLLVLVAGIIVLFLLSQKGMLPKRLKKKKK